MSPRLNTKQIQEVGHIDRTGRTVPLKSKTTHVAYIRFQLSNISKIKLLTSIKISVDTIMTQVPLGIKRWKG